MDDMLMRSLIDRLWPLAIFGICFLVFAKYLSEMIEFRLSPGVIRLAGALLLAFAVGLFLYAYVNASLHVRR